MAVTSIAPRHVLWMALGLVALTIAVYAPVRHFEFVSLDDPLYVSQNPDVAAGLTWHGVAWAFTTNHAANWHPLTWLSHMIDAQLFGMRAGPPHVVNVLLHIANTLLLFWVLARMTGATGKSAFVAALFAVHPVHVESVAWIAERKDVLSTLFGLLAIWAYAGYARRPDWRRYSAVFVLLACGLMAKPMLVTLPLLLLLLDLWPLRRATLSADPASQERWASLVREKLPLVALAAVSSVVTFLVQRQNGAVAALQIAPLPLRIGNALVAYLAYIEHALWPARLAALYPYGWTLSPSRVALATAVLLGVSIAVWRGGRRYPYLLTGWLWFLGGLIPVIGLVQVGVQAMADRYTYVPLIGLFIIVAWGVPDLLARRLPKAALTTGACLLILLCAVTAHAQVQHWRNAFALWQHALDVTSNNDSAEGAMGALLAQDGRTEEAIRHFNEALRIQPNEPVTSYNLGLALAKEHRFDEAAARYVDVLRLKPDFPEAHNSLGLALLSLGKIDEAIQEFTIAVRLMAALDPGDEHAKSLPQAHSSLAFALARAGRNSEAIEQCAIALRLDPAAPGSHFNCGQVFAQQGKIPEAVSEYTEALRLKPDDAEAHNELGYVLSAEGKMDEAVAHYAEALRLDPTLASAHNNWGFALATRGQVGEAIGHFSDAVRLRPDFEGARVNLGMALAAAGRTDEAIREFLEVLRVNPRQESALRALDRLRKSGKQPLEHGE